MKNHRFLKMIFNSNTLFAVFIAMGAVLYSLNATSNQSPPKIIFVQKGTDVKSLLQTLQEKGIIKNRLTYEIAFLLTKISGEPKPGAYYFRNGMSALAINSKLKDPDYKYVSIQEGWRKEQIANAYAAVLNWDEETKNSFGESFPYCPVSGREGYLYPGDYYVPKDASVQTITSTMEDKFDQNFSTLPSVNKDSNITSQDQIVKIASLIQREAADKNDMRLISGVIWNRIFRDMPLQIDATLQYVKGDENNWWPVPSSKDKFVDSPYNLYQNKGLPPTPISNPGKAALEAALNPLPTACLYYLHDKNGNIHCATTYQGHLANIKSYL